MNDLYVRFFRMAERKIVEDAGRGIICFISNYSWLDSLSFTGMREHFVDVFDRVTIDCLNGDKYKTGKITPEGKPDPSVFSTDWNREGIQVGTAVTMLVRQEDHVDVPTIEFRNFWGKEKRKNLLAAIDEQTGYEKVVPPVELGFPFIPTATEANYFTWPLLPDLFPVSFPGVKTSRDNLVVDIDSDRLEERMKAYFDPKVSDEEMQRICDQATTSTKRFNALKVRRMLQTRGVLTGNFIRYVYRPFDLRWAYWEPETKLLDEKRSDYKPHVFQGNVFLFSTGRTRKGVPEPSLLVSQLCDLNCMDSGGRGFPQMLAPLSGDDDLFDAPTENEAKPNLSDGASDYLSNIGAGHEALFFHAVAVTNSELYRKQNLDALRSNWPRIPLPVTRSMLETSSNLGREVSSLLDPEKEVKGVTSGKIQSNLRQFGIFTLPEDHTLDEEQDFAISAGWGHAGQRGITMPGRGVLREREAAVPGELQPLLGEKSYDVMLNKTTCWANVPERVWEYTLGGYQVIKKWLSYREQELLGRPLRLEEVRYVEQMIRRITALLLLSTELDDNYEAVKLETYEWKTPSEK